MTFHIQGCPGRPMEHTCVSVGYLPKQLVKADARSGLTPRCIQNMTALLEGGKEEAGKTWLQGVGHWACP